MENGSDKQRTDDIEEMDKQRENGTGVLMVKRMCLEQTNNLADNSKYFGQFKR